MMKNVFGFPSSNTTQSNNNNPTELPTTIVEEILTWVPTKSLIRFKSLSKHYSNLIGSNSTFIKMQISRTFSYQNHHNNNSHGGGTSFIIRRVEPLINFYYIPNGEFEKAVKLDTHFLPEIAEILGSSNGVVCLTHKRFSLDVLDMSLWNPATKEYKKLPLPQIQEPGEYDSLGFGFHPAINDYKVVRLVQVLEDGGPIFHAEEQVLEDGGPIFHAEVEVYSLTTNSWRMLGAIPYNVMDQFSRANICGILHWVASYPTSSDCDLILAFDLAKEVFREVPLPENLDLQHGKEVYLQTFRGFLSMCVQSRSNRDVDIWVMEEYGVKGSWNYLFNVKHESFYLYPVALLKKDEILLHDMDGRLRLVLYNSETTQELQILNFDCKCNMDIVPHVQTLAQLMTENQIVGGRGPNCTEVSSQISGDSQIAAHWTPEWHRVFVDLCVDQVQKGNMVGSSLNEHGWKELCEEFTKKTSVIYDRHQMKNHWDSTKESCEVWHKNNPNAAQHCYEGRLFCNELDCVCGGMTGAGDWCRNSGSVDNVATQDVARNDMTKDKEPQTQQ